MRTAFLLSAMALAAGCAQSNHLGRDEQVVFFPSVGYALQGGNEWVLPVHGWVYESSWISRHLDWAADVLDLETIMEDPADRAMLRERIVPFVVSSLEGREVPIVLGDEMVRLSPALENGHFYDELRVPADFLVTMQVSGTAASPVVEYRARYAPSDDRECIGRVHLLSPQGVSIVSDIDDTIRVTEVNHTRKMLHNTFVEQFQPVAGMADLYRQWAERWGAQFHYLSASPAQLVYPLEDFLKSNAFPEGSLALRPIEWRGGGLKKLLGLFDAPVDFKIGELAWLMRTLPERRYVLVGDSGQHDPEVYGAVARSFRPQVQLILIRDVTCCQERDDPRYQTAFRDLPDDLWVLFREPAQVRSQLEEKLQERAQPQNRPEPPWPNVSLQQLAAYN